MCEARWDGLHRGKVGGGTLTDSDGTRTETAADCDALASTVFVSVTGELEAPALPPLPDVVAVGELDVWIEVVPSVFDVVVAPLPEVVSVDDVALVEVVAGLVDKEDEEDEASVLDVLDADATGNAPCD